MTKSKKKRSTTSRPVHSSAQWPWLVVGILCGLFAAGLAYLHFMEREQSALQRSTVAKQKNIPEPHFDFYTMLPQADSTPPPTLKAVPEKPKPSPEKAVPSKLYTLQAASFGRQQEADQLKAQLILAGFDVTVKEFNVNGKIYYRVILGPYNDKAAAKAAQQRLLEHNIKALLVNK